MVIRPVLILFCIAGALAVETVNKDLSVSNADRTIDMASQLVKINTKLTLSNGGQSPVKSFHFTVDDNDLDKVAFIGATVGQVWQLPISKYLKSYKRTPCKDPP